MNYHWIENIKNNLIRISTPYTSGNGVVIPNWNLIITHEHIVRDCKHVLVEGINIIRQNCEVFFLDEKTDIAFISFSFESSSPLTINKDESVEDIVAAGLSVSSELLIRNGIKLPMSNSDVFIKHNAIFNPENNGSPIFNTKGELLGISIFSKENEIMLGFYLPMKIVESAYEKYRIIFPIKATTCTTCDTIVVDYSKSCSNCNASIKSISHIEEYEAKGINRLIEDVISKLGYEVGVSRRGNSKWLIDEGSAKITITYNEKSGFIVAEASLAFYNQQNETQMYTYLMKQNYFNKGMSFSLKDDSIILSLMIYDQHLHFNACKKLIGNLIKNADRYDNILINEFGAKG